MTTIFTFYNNEAYRADAERLGRCCAHFGVPFEAVEGKELGSWVRNCNQKPRLLATVRKRVRGPIVWLDSDCVIHRPPATLLEPRSADAMLWCGAITQKHYVSSQVMWWNDTPAAHAIIDEWAALSLHHRDTLADWLLKRVIDTGWLDRAAIDTLPGHYIKPYWKPVEGVCSAAIVISSNERRCTHVDATPRQDRVRLDPFYLPFETAADQR
ncbi:MAG: hypothetical protein AAGE01_07880 [Pseudomonadota bacterium]